MHQMCRICLQSFSKMISIESYGLRTAYEQLTGVSVEHDDGLPRELCVECATLLDKYHKFRDKSIKGDQLLRQIYNDYGYISKDYIEANCLKISPLIAIHNCNIINMTYEDGPKNNDKEIMIQKNYEHNEAVSDNVNKYDKNIINNDTIFIKIENNVDSNDFYEEENIFITDKQTMVLDTKKVVKNKVNNKISKNIIRNNETKVKNKKTKNKPKNKVISLNHTRKINNDLLLEEYFKVTELSFDDQIKSLEERKLSSNYLNNKFKCDYCYRGFQCEGSYNTHMQKHSQDRGEYSCKICRATFLKTELVTKHHRQTHLYKYDCVKCHITIANRTSAVFHAVWHKGRKYACEQCDAVFDKKTTYLGHVRIKHPSDHACQYCGYSYLGEKGLYSHKNKKHYMETQVELSGPWCNDCNIQFYNEDALTVHNGIKHTNLDRLPRNETPSSGADRHDKPIRVRERRKTPRQLKEKIRYPVPCEACGVELKSGAEYRFHFMRSHPDRSRTFYPYLDTLICDKCGKIFACASFLSTHLLTHSDSRPYSCPACPKRFKTPVQLRTHRKIHIAPSYPCEVCGLMYNQKGNRDRHVRQVHSDEKNFKCDYCEKSFKSNSDKKLHTRHIHWKEPWPKRNRKCTDKKTGGHSDPP